MLKISNFFLNWSIILQFLTLFFLKKKTFAHFWSLMNCWMAFVSFSHRFSIKGRVYPALLPVENKKVTGRVGSSNFIIAASECCYCFCSGIILIWVSLLKKILSCVLALKCYFRVINWLILYIGKSCFNNFHIVSRPRSISTNSLNRPWS